MSLPNLFLDANIFLDCINPWRRQSFCCSNILMERIKNRYYNAWTADYILSETLGRLKGDKERELGLTHIHRQRLTRHEIDQMARIVYEFKDIPNLEVFEPEHITQEEIFDKVKTVCVQAKDALVLLSALNLRNNVSNVTLVTRDDRLIYRGRVLIDVAHPSKYVDSCPQECRSITTCNYRK